MILENANAERCLLSDSYKVVAKLKQAVASDRSNLERSNILSINELKYQSSVSGSSFKCVKNSESNLITKCEDPTMLRLDFEDCSTMQVASEASVSNSATTSTVFDSTARRKKTIYWPTHAAKNQQLNNSFSHKFHRLNNRHSSKRKAKPIEDSNEQSKHLQIYLKQNNQILFDFLVCCSYHTLSWNCYSMHCTLV
jgi:hypothetical protein